MNRRWFIIAFLIAITIVVYFVNKTSASQCNANNPDNCPIPTQICDNGEHIGNPHCITPTPTIQPSCTPTDSPTSTNDPTVTPSPICLQQGDEDIQVPCPTATLTPTPTAGESATPTPTVSSSSNSVSSNSSNNTSTASMPQSAPNTGHAL